MLLMPDPRERGILAPSIAPVDKRELKEAEREAERRREAIARRGDLRKFEAFGKLYERDIVAFAHDCFYWEEGQGLTSYQEEILQRVVDERRVCVRGPHGLGKSTSASIGVHWHVLTRSALGVDFKTATTASAWRQLEKYLWPEIWKQSNLLNWGKIGRAPYTRAERLLLGMKMEGGLAFAVASDNHNYIEGLHADSIFYVFDESKAIPDQTWDAAEGAFSAAGGDTANEAFVLSISTPGEPVGRFYQIHSRAKGLEEWWVRHVTVEEAIAAGRISREWVERRKAQWGEGSAIFQNRCLGEFCSSDADSLVPLAWVLKAMEDNDTDDVRGEEQETNQGM